MREGQPPINRLPQSLPGSGAPIGFDMGGVCGVVEWSHMALAVSPWAG